MPPLRIDMRRERLPDMCGRPVLAVFEREERTMTQGFLEGEGLDALSSEDILLALDVLNWYRRNTADGQTSARDALIRVETVLGEHLIDRNEG